MREEKAQLDSSHLHSESYLASLRTKNMNRLKSITSFELADLFEFLKTLLLISLPHLTILCLFFVYSILGATVMQQLETTDLFNSNLKQSIDIKQNIDSKLFDKFESSIQVKLREWREEFEKVQEDKNDLETLELVSQFLAANRINAKKSEQTLRQLYSLFMNYKRSLISDYNEHTLKLIREEKSKFLKTSLAKPGETMRSLNNKLSWDFPNSLYYTITLLTTIG